MRRLALGLVTGLAVVALSGGAALAVETVVVEDPPADGVAPGGGMVLEQSDDNTPVGFIAGYVGLTALGLAAAGVVRRSRRAAPVDPSTLGIAYGRRSAADFWAEPPATAAGRPPRSVARRGGDMVREQAPGALR